MPLYEYECDACGRRFEVIQKFSDPPAEACRHCAKGPVHRLVSSPAIQFKGAGWYVNDYGKGKSDATTPSAGKAGDGAKAGEGGKTGDNAAGSSSTSADSGSSKPDSSKGDTGASSSGSSSGPASPGTDSSGSKGSGS